MAYADWMISTKRLVSCNCNYGCPCEFNAPPTHEKCEGVEALEITEGYFGDVRLDGLKVAGIFHWPGPVHEGGGTYQIIIDESATEEQQEALFKIFSGEEQEPTTMFNIYASTIDKEPEPIVAKIEFEWNIKKRKGRIAVSGICESSIEPIRNPVTGDTHRAVIKLPEGFEYREAEMASATFWSNGPITQEYQDCYGFLTYASYGPYGVIEDLSYPAAEV